MDPIVSAIVLSKGRFYVHDRHSFSCLLFSRHLHLEKCTAIGHIARLIPE